MATRLKKGSKAARDYMAKIRGMKKSAPKKKAAPVNIAVGSLPFTGKFLGINISARTYHEGIKINVGSYSLNYYKGDNAAVLSEDISKIIYKNQKSYQTVTDHDKRKILAAVKKFVSTLKNEFPKNSVKKTSNKIIVKKVTTSTNDRQAGTSNKDYDRKRVALPPGIRKSKKTGNEYTERRANRSDKKGSLLGIGDFFDTKVIADLDNLKKEYKKLAMKYHPDKGGTTAQMQSINAEYDKLREKILKSSNLTEDQRKNEIVIDDAIRDIIDVIILIPNINIELIGKWIWVSGKTYAVKSELSAAGLEFIRKAGAPYWVYKGVESKSRGGTPMDEIKKKYGVHKFDHKPPKNISGIPFVRISLSNRAKLKRSLKKLVLAINKRPI